MADLSVNIAGVALKNPLIAASGAFGFGEEYSAFYPISVLGGVSSKGLTLAPRPGNPPPRIAETPSGMLNSVGLQNPGIDHVIAEELPALRKIFHKPIMANISGFSLDEYVECCAKADASPHTDLIEVNVSCPNVHHGGMSFGTDPNMVYDVTRAVKAVCKKPVYLKLSPNVTDIVSIAKACQEGGADGLSLINTLMGMRIDLKKRAPILANTTGGLSGPAIFPVALRMVWQVYEAVDLPIIGMGGVQTAEDVVEMMLAGATAVQVGAANLVNPYACQEIVQTLPSLLERLGVQDINELIGGAHGWEKM